MRLTVLAFSLTFLLGAPTGDRHKARTHYERGLDSLRQGDLEKAAKEFKKATHADPGWADAHYQLGQVQLSLGHWDQAEASNHRAAELDPNLEDAQWWELTFSDRENLEEAERLTVEEDFEGASGELLGFLDSGGDIQRFHDALSFSAVPLGSMSSVVSELLERFADSAQWNRLEETARYWSLLAPERKHEFLWRVSEIYRERRAWSLAMEWLRRWERESPEDPLGFLSSLGSLYLSEGNVAEAAATHERFVETLQKDPTLVCHHINGAFVEHFGGAFQPVSLVTRTPPRYTPEALSARIEGVLEVTAIVEPDGTVSSPRIEGQGLGYGLDELALRDLTDWRFSPARINGIPIRQSFSVTMTFALGW